MAQLKADLINGNDATLTVEGWTFNRTAIVYNLEPYFGYLKLVKATEYLQTQGAYIGQPHPAWPTAYCRQISPVAISNDTIEFALVYKENPPVGITLNTSLSQESTNIDATGLKIELEYTYPIDYVDPNTGATSSLAGKTVKQGGTVMKYIPETSFTYNRVEALTGMQLIAKKKQYEGKINNDSWDLGGVQQPQFTWLCGGITGDSSDGGITYNVTYTFIYRKDTWRPKTVFVRVDGNPAPDAVFPSSAYQDWPIYEVINFNPLGIV